MATRIGAVIVFRASVTGEQARSIIHQLEEDGVVDGQQWIGDETPIHYFDEKSGGPVWYIP